MDDQTFQLASSLATIIGQSTLDIVRRKIEVARTKKQVIELQNDYEDIINTLIQNKIETERIAQEYKALYDNLTISDGDIEYLQSTLRNVLNLFFSYSPESKSNEQGFKVILELLNKDTLKTMQLIGFNYKEAIGKPLTEICATALHQTLHSSKNRTNVVNNVKHK